ncbi:MAG: hypothetical protein GY724_26590 [Actinomycetia bacterium]|nr:hypothetical protein [Actinomycetes bacterium]MCP4227081.1 hypothetical protein [Actinomycetes bacterium]MCP5034788.1 hypothetical protein [Actinomycetes bacterium]
MVETLRGPLDPTPGLAVGPNLTSSQRALPGFEEAIPETVAHAGHGIVRQRPKVICEPTLGFFTP